MKPTLPSTKTIECPQCGSAATLNLFPGIFTGIWECTNEDCAASDYCEHTNIHEEIIEVATTTQKGEYDGYEVTIKVCDECGFRLQEDE